MSFFFYPGRFKDLSIIETVTIINQTYLNQFWVDRSIEHQVWEPWRESVSHREPFEKLRHKSWTQGCDAEILGYPNGSVPTQIQDMIDMIDIAKINRNKSIVNSQVL